MTTEIGPNVYVPQWTARTMLVFTQFFVLTGPLSKNFTFTTHSKTHHNLLNLVPCKK